MSTTDDIKMSTTKRKINDDVSSKDERNDGTIEDIKDLKENNQQLIQLMKDDTRIGWPDSIPAIEPKKHGWFRQGNLEVLQYLLQKNFKIIVELGSWLGSSTKFLLTECPDAVVFAVDIWSNEVFNTYNYSYYLLLFFAALPVRFAL